MSWALLALCLLTVTQGLEIISIQTNQYVQNNRWYQNTSVTFICSEDDYGVPQQYIVEADNSTGQAGHVIDITCNEPRIIYRRAVFGWVPLTTQIQEIRQCYSSGPQKYSNAENNLIPDTFLGDQLPGDLADQLPPTRRRLLFNIVTGISFISTAILGKDPIGMLVCDVFRACPGGGRETDISEAVDKYLDKKKILVDFENQLDAAQDTFNRDITAVTQQITENQNTTLFAIRENLRAVNASDQARRKFQQYAAQQIRAAQQDIEGNIALIAQNANNLDTFANITDLALKTIIDGIQQLTEDLNAQLVDLSNNTARNFEIAEEERRRGIRRLREVTSIIMEQASKRQLRRIVAQIAFAAIDTYESIGELEAFVDDEGIRPIESTSPQYPAIKNLQIDEVSLIYVDSDVSPQANQVAYSLRCRTSLLLNRGRNWFDWRDIMEALGPQNCTVEDDACDCWVHVEERRCTWNSAAVPLGSIAFFNRSTLTQAPSMCAGPTVTTEFDAVSLDQLEVSLADVCNDPNQLGSDYNLISQQMFARIGVPEVPSACTVELEDTFVSVNNGGDINFIWALYQYWQRAFELATQNYAELENLFYGRPPAGLSYQNRPFEKLEGSPELVTCDVTAFAARSTEPYESVGLLQPLQQVTDVTISVDGGPAELISDVQLIIPSDFVLPERIVWFGLVNDIFSRMTVFDVPDNQVSLSNVAKSLEDTVNYLMTNDSTQTQLDYWKILHGTSFNHFAAGNSISLYERDIVGTGTDVLCTGSDETGGPICNILEFFRVNAPFGPLGETQVIFTPKESNMQFTVRGLDDGITPVINSVCPSYSPGPNTGLQLQLTFANPNDLAIDVAVEIFGDCPQPLDDFKIAGGETVIRKLPLCLNGNGTMTMSVYRFEQGVPVLCNDDAYDVTVEPVEVTGFTGTVITNAVQTTRVVSEDSSVLAASRVNAKLTEDLYAVTRTVRVLWDVLVTPYLTSANVIQQNFDELQVRSALTVGEIKNETVELANRQQENLFNATLDLDTEIDARLLTAIEFLNQTEQGVQNLVARQAIANATATYIQTLTNLTINARLEELAADEVLLTAIQDALDGKADKCGSDFPLFGYFITFFECDLLPALVPILLIAGGGILCICCAPEILKLVRDTRKSTDTAGRFDGSLALTSHEVAALRVLLQQVGERNAEHTPLKSLQFDVMQFE